MTAVAVPSSYREWPAPAPLRRHVACSWSTGPRRDGGEPIYPDGCMDVMWDGVRLFVAGPDTRPSPDGHEGPFCIGVRMRPAAGALVVGLAAAELRDARVDLADLGGAWPGAGALADRLAACTTTGDARRLLEDAVGRRLADVAPPDPLVERAAGAWRADPCRAPVAALSAASGLSERQLHRRFVAAVGYGPKQLHRILRFQRFLAACTAAPERGLGELAYACGFADQAHLTRDAAALAGRTPAQLRAARAGGVRFVQDAG